MKTKRIFALILTLVLSLMIAAQTTPIWAKEQADFSLSFELSSEGKQVVMANHNDVITVTFSMKRTDLDEGYTTNGFQNHIYYDLSFFEFVEGSIVCYDTESATAQKQNSITYGEIIQCQNMSSSYENAFVFCTFQLKIIGTSGSGMISCGAVQAFDMNHQKVSVSTKNIQVLIDIGCQHDSKTKVESQTSDCGAGWETYYDCDNCDAFFDATGNNLIPGIPYLDKVHSWSEDLSYDKLGHWYECKNCGEKSEYSSHKGGTATCASLATCSICGQQYGRVNADNHCGDTTIKNYDKPTILSAGYSGDIHCEDCGALLESGETIYASSIAPWMWWFLIILIMILICIVFPPFFLVCLIIILIILLTI